MIRFVYQKSKISLNEVKIMNHTEHLSGRFLSAFNEIESHLRTLYGQNSYIGFVDILDEAARKSFGIRSHRNELKAFALLRNAIVHNPFRRNIDPIAEPHREIVEEIERILIDITKPKTAYEAISVKISGIFSIGGNSNVHEIMKTMRKMKYSYVPIIENGSVIGVFSENTIFSYLIDNEIFMVEKDMRISNFGEYLLLNANDNEKFLFISKKESVYDSIQKFQQDSLDEKRIGAMFITENGKQTESLLGLITPWDIVKFAAILK